MTNIILTEQEIKILLINSLRQGGIDVDDIILKQKVQIFGQGRGIEINAEVIKKESASDINSLLNKLTYQQNNQFVQAQPQQAPMQSIQPTQQQATNNFGQQPSYTFEEPFRNE